MNRNTSSQVVPGAVGTATVAAKAPTMAKPYAHHIYLDY